MCVCSTKNSLAENEEKRISWIGYSSDFAASAVPLQRSRLRCCRCYNPPPLLWRHCCYDLISTTAAAAGCDCVTDVRVMAFCCDYYEFTTGSKLQLLYSWMPELHVRDTIAELINVWDTARLSNERSLRVNWAFCRRAGRRSINTFDR